MKTFTTLFCILCLSQFTRSQCWCISDFSSYTVTTSGTNAIQIAWVAPDESVNGVTYYIEKSTDGANFYAIKDFAYQHVPNASYSYIDNCGRPSTSINTLYYRIKSVNNTGNVVISNIKTISVQTRNVGTCPTCSSYTLTGPSAICGTGANYHVSYTTSPITSWTSSNTSLATVTQSNIINNDAAVSTNVTNGQTITLSVAISGCPALTKTIFLGTPSLSFIGTPGSCAGGGVQNYTFSATPASGGSNWTWSVDYVSPGGSVSINFPHSASTSASVKGTVRIKVTYNDLCGVAQTAYLAGIQSNCTGRVATTYNFTPNPARDNVVITSNNSDGVEKHRIYAIKITDRFGALRKSIEKIGGAESKRISLENLPTGTYVISIYDGKEWHSDKLAIQ